MRVRFTKMHGAGNDFVVLDATRAPLALTAAQLQKLGDRRFGVGADQILVVEAAPRDGVDFRYRIFNGSTGAEVEHCGNGARCFVRYVRDHGLSDRDVIRVATMNNELELRLQPDGRVTVNMNQRALTRRCCLSTPAAWRRARSTASRCGRWPCRAGPRWKWPWSRWATLMPCSGWTT